MKLLIASDLHGDAECTAELLDIFEKEKCDKILLLGDILYHGPRNDLPSGYAPKKVIALLNEVSDKILAVRGNCDTEVDQMVLNFPILADYAYVSVGGTTVFATHGHKFGFDNPPPLRTNEILLTGHTHVLKIEKLGCGNYYLNPGSVSIPKEGNPRSYAVLENQRFEIKDFSGKVILAKDF